MQKFAIVVTIPEDNDFEPDGTEEVCDLVDLAVKRWVESRKYTSSLMGVTFTPLSSEISC